MVLETSNIPVGETKQKGINKGTVVFASTAYLKICSREKYALKI
jgi:hypothetical protein